MGYNIDYSQRTNLVGIGGVAWHKPSLDDNSGQEQKWHVGYGLTGSVQWIRRAFGRLPEHTMVYLQGYKMVVLSGEEVHQLNPQAPVPKEGFHVYGLRYTGSPEDKQRVFLWNLNKTEEKLVTALNEEVGYVRECQNIWDSGREIPITFDLPSDHTLGRDREPTDALLINGYESSMRVADIFHASFFPSQVEGQQISIGGKEQR